MHPSTRMIEGLSTANEAPLCDILHTMNLAFRTIAVNVCCKTLPDREHRVENKLPGCFVVHEMEMAFGKFAITNYRTLTYGGTE